MTGWVPNISAWEWVFEMFTRCLRFTHSRKNRQLHWCRLHPLMYRFLVQRTVSSNLEDGGGWTSYFFLKSIEAHHGSSFFHLSLYWNGSIPINTIFRGMNIHLPAILMFTRGTRFWHTAILEWHGMVFFGGLSLPMAISESFGQGISDLRAPQGAHAQPRVMRDPGVKMGRTPVVTPWFCGESSQCSSP